MKNRGFTLTEALAASAIMLLGLSTILLISITLQNSWRGGNTQIFLQMQTRLAMNKMLRQIRPGLLATVSNGGNTLKVRLDPNHTQTTSDDIWCQYEFADNRIAFTPDILLANYEIILDNVYKNNDRDIFSIDGKNITIVFSVKEPTGLYGYKGSYMETSVTLRNE